MVAVSLGHALGAWERLPDAPEVLRRAGHASAVAGDTIFFICGRTQCAPLCLLCLTVAARADTPLRRVSERGNARAARLPTERRALTLPPQQGYLARGRHKLQHSHRTLGPGARARAVRAARLPHRDAGGRRGRGRGRLRQDRALR
jgi:hypothetical protein